MFLRLVWLLSYKTPLKHFELDIAAFTLSGYGLATLLGNVVYTLVNYIYNKIPEQVWPTAYVLW